MRKTSLAGPERTCPSSSDEAEHRKRRILILRHGKPAATIVPVDVAAPRKARVAMSEREVEGFFRAAAAGGDPALFAVDDLLGERR